jgi:glutamate carboxypeptidase
MPDPAALRRIVEARFPQFVDELARLVNVDCGSYTPEGVNVVADHVTDALRATGASVERTAHRPQPGQRQLGDLVVGRLDGDGPRVPSSATWTRCSTRGRPRRGRIGRRAIAPSARA